MVVAGVTERVALDAEVVLEAADVCVDVDVVVLDSDA